MYSTYWLIFYFIILKTYLALCAAGAYLLCLYQIRPHKGHTDMPEKHSVNLLTPLCLWDP